MEKTGYMPDNVFRYELGRNISRVQTPLKVFNISPERSMVVNAVWDTGATFSSVSKRVVDELQLPNDGKAVSIGVGGAISGKTSLCLAFPGNLRWAAMIEASHLPDVPGVPDFIVGLDIITMGDLRLTQENGQTVLSFIFDRNVFIDFENDTNEETVRKMMAFNERLKVMSNKFSL